MPTTIVPSVTSTGQLSDITYAHVINGRNQGVEEVLDIWNSDSMRRQQHKQVVKHAKRVQLINQRSFRSVY